MNKLVSIVLPVYNGAEYLIESINSILSQTYQNWELLILDDCSTDETADISKEFENKDSRIHYYRNDVNLRLPGNLNKGFSLSKGDYLTWTSDDNRFHETAIEKMVSKIEMTNGVDFVYASYNVIDGNGDCIDYYVVPTDCKDIIVGSNCIGACFLYTRRVYEAIGDYDVSLFLVEDFDYWQRIFARFTATSILDILYDYRKHENNLTNTMKKENFYTAYKRMLQKNIQLYSKLNFKKKYYYYTGINKCQLELKEHINKNEYKKYKKYKIIFNIFYEIPNRIKNKIIKLFCKK